MRTFSEKVRVVYKLTDENMQTRDGFPWALGVRVDEPDDGPLDLCEAGCLHSYASPELAAFMAPIQGRAADYTRCFRAEAYGETITDRTKIGARSLKLVEEVEYPRPTIEQRIYYGIRCARASGGALPDRWERWADGWISGEDRSAEAAEAAAVVSTAAALRVARAVAGDVACIDPARAAYWAVARIIGARALARAGRALACAVARTASSPASLLAAHAAALAADAGADLAPLAREAMEWTDEN